MVWLIVIVAVAVLGAGAMVAGGAFGGMPDEPERDDFRPALPPTRITGDDLRDVRFQVQLRGYDMTRVDELLERLGRELDQRDDELTELRRLAQDGGASERSAPAEARDTE
ncbi:DivIVA domain-containing protein [Naumannella cuiyingiana]|uniref:DivIVA domain-containing protein n=1 Tax=Naumannella cuiyingiana TaxID=1347891 RepID=A0A7Z0DAF3_9ACTN|nr:DivIVA domain-containing protein [Naumannella cuiyingiana]NYI71950.1 DivIVA domain-containing protein [Naumannella cuiyingiana]